MKHTLIASLTICSLLLGGCSQGTQQSQTSTNPVAQKTGKTTATGILKPLPKKSADATHTITQDGKTILVNSYSIDLKTYESKAVTVTGEFSGNTLFVDNIEPALKK